MLIENEKSKRKVKCQNKKYPKDEGISTHSPKGSVVECLKEDLSRLKNESTAQGAAEYILLFGGVIVIALAGLLIYKSYFSNNASGLNATQDISSIRNNMTSL